VLLKASSNAKYWNRKCKQKLKINRHSGNQPIGYSTSLHVGIKLEKDLVPAFGEDSEAPALGLVPKGASQN